MNPYFCTKANDNSWFEFYFVSILIIENENANLVIVIGFGAKIWIQLVEKGEIKNKFSIPYPIMYNPEKRQLHSLSIVDFRDFQCSRLFLGYMRKLYKKLESTSTYVKIKMYQKVYPNRTQYETVSKIGVDFYILLSQNQNASKNFELTSIYNL